MLSVAVATWLTSRFGPIRQVMKKNIADKNSKLDNGYMKMSLSDHIFAVFSIICLQRKKFKFYLFIMSKDFILQSHVMFYHRSQRKFYTIAKFKSARWLGVVFVYCRSGLFIYRCPHLLFDHSKDATHR